MTELHLSEVRAKSLPYGGGVILLRKSEAYHSSLQYFKNTSPPGFLHADCTRYHAEKSIGPTKSISDKKD